MASQLNISNLALLQIGEDVITQAQLTAESPKPAKLCSNFWAYIRDEVLEAHPWNFAKKHSPLDLWDEFGYYDSGDDKTTITAATQADPCVLSIATHPYETGNLILVEDVVGMTELNDRVFEVTDSAAGTIDLLGVDASKYTAYVSGGTARRVEAVEKYQSGYTYRLPADYLKALSLDGDVAYEIVGTGNNKRLLCTESDAVLIYISQVTDTTLFTNRFIMALAARLAAEMAIPLQKKGAKFETMMAKYEFHLTRSGLNDARENENWPSQDDSWLQVGGYE
jgi:hypothetical protein